MARGFETGSDNEKIDELQTQLDDIIDSQINAVGSNDNISIDSTRGSRNDAGGDAGGIRSNQPIIHTITDIDSSGTPTGVFDKINIISSMAIIDHTVANIDLKFIQGTVKDGVIIKITPKIGKTVTVKTGGNILTASDIVITDQQYYELVKHSQAETGVTGGAYKIFLSGTGGGTTLPVVDTTDIVKGSDDPTKLLRFEVDGFTPGTTRTITIPNTTTTMAGLGVVSQTWTGTNIFVGPVSIHDTNFFIQDGGDITKQFNFSLGGATMGKVMTLASNHTDNRILTLPNATTSLAGLGVTSQQWTGTNDFVGITTVIDVNFGIRDFGDNTKVATFDSSLISPATTRTYSLPNATTTLAGLGVVSQSWTGTNTFFGVTNFNGNVVLGDSSSDSITFIGDTIGDITANVDNTDDIGALSRTYAFGFFKGGVGIVEGYSTGFKPTGQTNTGIIFTVPTAGGKTELRCSFQTGASVLIVTEP